MRRFQGAFRENPQFFSLKTCARINYFIYYSKRQRFFFFFCILSELFVEGHELDMSTYGRL